jgi:hypothetical protein
MKPWIALHPRPNVRHSVLDEYEKQLAEYPEMTPTPTDWAWWIAVGVIGATCWAGLGYWLWRAWG